MVIIIVHLFALTAIKELYVDSVVFFVLNCTFKFIN
jgi:hypothetical protein